MQRGSTKHGPVKDDNLAHEVDGMVRARRDTRSQEWRSAEPPGEDQPRVSLMPEMPAGEDLLNADLSVNLSAAVEARSDLARWFDRHDFPARAAQLAHELRHRNAPDQLVEALLLLPKRERYNSFGDLWRALHGGNDVETVRF